MPERLPLILSLSKDAGWSRKPYEALLESATFAHSSASPRLRVNEATAGQHRPLPRWPKFICNRPALWERDRVRGLARQRDETSLMPLNVHCEKMQKPTRSLQILMCAFPQRTHRRLPPDQ